MPILQKVFIVLHLEPKKIFFFVHQQRDEKTKNLLTFQMLYGELCNQGSHALFFCQKFPPSALIGGFDSFAEQTGNEKKTTVFFVCTEKIKK